MLRKRYGLESLEVQKNFKLFKLPNSEAVIWDFLLKIKLIQFFENILTIKDLTDPFQNVLKMLNLSRNILTDISSETFSQLKRLHLLDLSFNSLAVLEPGCFISSTKLQSIYLQGNQLTSLSPMMFINLKLLFLLYL